MNTKLSGWIAMSVATIVLGVGAVCFNTVRAAPVAQAVPEECEENLALCPYHGCEGENVTIELDEGSVTLCCGASDQATMGRIGQCTTGECDECQLLFEKKLACCAAGMLECDQDGSGTVDCADLEMFASDQSGTCEFSDEQKWQLACCFISECGEDWCEEGATGCGGDCSSGPCGAFCDDLADCIEGLFNSSLQEEDKEALNDCIEAGFGPGEDCGDFDCCQNVGGVVYYECGDVFQCDRTGDGTVDCEDLKQFIDDSATCYTQQDPMTREDVIDMVCTFWENCEPSGMCSSLTDCVQDIMNDNFGEGDEEDPILKLAPLMPGESDELSSCTGCEIDPPEGGDGDDQGEGDDGCGGDCTGEAVDTNSEGGNPQACNAVDLRRGDKFESTTDLVVRVTGQEFVLRRSYRGLDGYSTPVLSGEKWSLSAFSQLRIPGSGDVSNPGYGGRLVEITYSEDYPFGATAKMAPGPATQFIDKATVTIETVEYPVYRLTEPGAWQMDYYRPKDGGEGESVVDPNSALIGHLAQARDNYGNTQTYQYAIFGGLSARLATISLNEPSGGGDPEAEVRFGWNLLPSDPNFGRLIAVQVIRFDSQSTPILTQQVQYTYYGDSPSHSLDLGTDGDLVQVMKYVRVDPDPGSSQSRWSIQATQYRYHSDAQQASTGVAARGMTWNGNDHELKMVLQPEQIEFAAQRMNATADPAIYHDAAAETLLTKDDDDVLYTEQSDDVLLVDLAAKVVESYDASRRVSRQFVQSACGCGGSGTQGLKLEYEYLTYTWASGDPGWTTVIHQFRNESGWVAHKDIYHDLALQGPAPISGPDTRVPYLVSKAVIEKVQGGGDGRVWATRQEYNQTSRWLHRSHTPAALTASGATTYTKASQGTPPSYGTPDPGLIYEYGFTSDNRRSSVAIKDGSSGTATLISRITYGDPGSNADERRYLPKVVERFQTVEAGQDPDNSSYADEIETTTYAYDFHEQALGDDDIFWIETEVEAELATELGPGGSVSYVSHEVFDTRGRNYWSRAADESLTRREFDGNTGVVIKVVRNEDPTDTGIPTEWELPSSGLPQSFPGRFSDGESLTTTYVRDVLGRVQQRTTPGGVSTYTRREARESFDRPGILYYAEVSLPHEMTAGSEYDGPASVQWLNADGDSIGASDFELDSSYSFGTSQTGYTVPITDYSLDEADGELTHEVTSHDLSGLVVQRSVWAEIDGGTGAPPVTRYDTDYAYDSLGRLETTTNAEGTIRQSTYDVLDRVISVDVGTSGGMTEVATYTYDAGNEGNSNVTSMTQRLGTATDRVTDYVYDFRDRLVYTENPELPNEITVYDNLDLATHRAVLGSTGAQPLSYDVDTADTDRERLTETVYGQRGLVVIQRVAIDPSLASESREHLENRTWYDEVGRAVGNWSPNAPRTKTTFDGLGRPSVVYVTDGRDLSSSNDRDDTYADVYSLSSHAVDLTGDVVFEQIEYSYIDGSATAHAGVLELVTSRRRAHHATDSETGDLTGLDDEYFITTWTATFYDDADRVHKTANYGTNTTGFVTNDDAPTISQSSPPAASTTVLVTETTYGSRGLVATTLDPDGKVTAFLYDDMNRRIAVIENYVNATVGWTSTEGRWEVTGGLHPNEPDADRVTSFVYDGNSNVTQQVAHLPDTAEGPEGSAQVTLYTYGVSAQDDPLASELESNDLLRSVVYPDDDEQDDDDRTVLYAWNRQGELIAMRDQNETVHDYTRDEWGRVTVDEVTIESATIDSAVEAIETTYDDAGRIKEIKSLDGSAQAVNGVGFQYNGLWQITAVDQDHNGALQLTGDPPVPTGDTERVGYTYAQSDADDGNYSRVQAITYPDGSTLNPIYGHPPGLGEPFQSDYFVSRIVELKLDSTAEARYDHIGLSMFALADLLVPDVQLDRTAKHTGQRHTVGYTNNAGSYPGFDRFGRVVSQMWVDGGFTVHGTDPDVPNVPPIVELAYTYDASSNRESAIDARPGVLQPLSHAYDYDGLDRLTAADRGQPDGSGVTPDILSREWKLDMLGNWKELRTDYDGGGMGGLSANEIQPRTHNAVNELTTLDLDGQDSNPPLDFEYDKAGNLREQQTTDGSTKLIYTHDAWNRLVKVEFDDSSTTEVRAEYEFNGLNWRTIKRADTATPFDGILDQQRIMFYSSGWQLLEERIDDDFASGPSIDRHVQYVWGPRYIDDVVLHRQDVGLDGYEDVWYHLTDAQYSSVALIDDTAVIAERVTYTAYGQARHHWIGDVDGDGAVTTGRTGDDGIIADLDTANAVIGDQNYRAEADINRDGVNDSADAAAGATGTAKSALAFGVLSDSSIDNQIGYDGYVFNVETLQYCVRFRTYDPTLGRWLERDPAGVRLTWVTRTSSHGESGARLAACNGGAILAPIAAQSEYADGMNLFQAVRSSPVKLMDPFGLAADMLPEDVDKWALICRKLDGWKNVPMFGRIGRHCVIICNGTRYSLVNRNGIATPGIDNPEDLGRPADQWEIYATGTESGRNKDFCDGGMCDCLAMAMGLNLGTYTYQRDNCNSNWFVDQMLRACGKNTKKKGTYAERCGRVVTTPDPKSRSGQQSRWVDLSSSKFTQVYPAPACGSSGGKKPSCHNFPIFN